MEDGQDAATRNARVHALVRRRDAGLYALVGAGGAVGALARFVIAETVPGASQLVTLGINVTGAFLLGALVTLLAGRHPRAQVLLGTGLLGGFTTYSLFALETAELVSGGLNSGGAATQLPGLALGLGLGLGTIVLCFAATLLGAWGGSRLRRLAS